jgi:hypothetical protein
MRKLLQPQNEQEIKMPIKLVGVWFLLNWWGVRLYTAFGIVRNTREKQMAGFKERKCVLTDG